MIRITTEEKQPQVVTKADYEEDRRRGYCITVWQPERVETITDRRSGLKATRTLPAVLNYRCMECQFDTVTESLMKEHRFHGDHNWAYTPFNNPYGHCSDVIIEGIEDYSQLSQENI